MKRFMVTYIDDFHKKHITFVTSMAEVDFIRDRFTFVEMKLLAAAVA